MGWFSKPVEAMSPEAAKARVFEHWEDLNALCERRFPRSENLAHEALLFAVDRLERDGWRRVCVWQGKSSFRTFLLTLTARLLTDFSRERFGHIRPPQWLDRMTDPIWSKAYKLMMIDKYQRREAVEILHLAEPQRERGFLEEMTARIVAGCPSRPEFGEASVALDAVAEPADPRSDTDDAARASDAELELVLLQYLDADLGADVSDPRIRALRECLRPYLDLSQEDRALLRMRCIDGLKMGAVADALGLQGDPYKRYHRLIRELTAACRSAGLLCDR